MYNLHLSSLISRIVTENDIVAYQDTSTFMEAADKHLSYTFENNIIEDPEHQDSTGVK